MNTLKYFLLLGLVAAGAGVDTNLPPPIVESFAAADLLGWRAERSLADMCTDTWRWQRLNPHGFNSSQ